MISVVIPSYNRRDCITRLLDDLRKQEGVDFEVVVVDDCSPDDTVEVVSREYPEVNLLVNEKNGGPCVTRNRGVKAAKGEIVVGLDSDVTVPDHGLLAKVQEAFDRNSKACGFAFRIFTPDGQTDDLPRWWHPVPIEEGRDRGFETDYFSGTAYAFHREKMITAGLYPEILYMHYEEVELAYRIIDAGDSIFYAPELTALHHESKVAKRGMIQLFYKPRNQILLAVACLPMTRAIRYLVPRMGFQFAKAVGGLHLMTFSRAIGGALKLLPQRLKDRRPLKSETLQRMEAMREGLYES